ncbi:PepSY-like domain-containing protein [Spirosoma sp. SC4-14]|uniref:PepSY-like domain-containing protein n=1 Tax=Spirosoma sp. SC4-14 TaxID=3128900 RepID=UPI0030D19473
MKALFVFSCMAALVLSLNACNHNAVDPSSTDGSARSSGVVSGTATGPGSLTSVDVSTLPSAITTYINTNYAGATIKEAGTDPKGNYVVIITLNNELRLLAFKADGTFIKELKGGKGRPMPGDSLHHPKGDSLHHPRHAPGDSLHHPPMPGDSLHHPHGDSLHHKGPGPGANVTVIAASDLPSAITTYINTNYAGATIEQAAKDNASSDYIVLIKTSDSKRVLLLFGSDGTFKKAIKGK